MPVKTPCYDIQNTNILSDTGAANRQKVNRQEAKYEIFSEVSTIYNKEVIIMTIHLCIDVVLERWKLLLAFRDLI